MKKQKNKTLNIFKIYQSVKKGHFVTTYVQNLYLRFGLTKVVWIKTQQLPLFFIALFAWSRG